MSTITALTSTLRVPCALQHYLRQMDPKAPSHALSQGECQMAFQHWVAYIRGGDCGHPSHVTAEEQLRCPLLWCRKSFDNLASTLQHVSECPWLSNAWYWCPYCCRPESFIVSEESYVDPTQHSIQRKDSKLRRAVTFFKHLGLKSCSRHKTSGSSSACEPESFDTWLDKRRRSEMEDTSHEISMCAELAHSGSDVHGRGSYIEKQAKAVYEMEGTTIDTLQRPDCLLRYPKEADSPSQPCELDVGPLTMGPNLRGENMSPADSLAGIGAQFEAAPHDVEPKEEILVSPASTIGTPFSHRRVEPITSPYAEIGPPRQAYNNLDTVSLPEVVSHHQCQVDVALRHGGSLPSSANVASLHDGVTSSMQPQVQDLRETVRVLNEEWLRRCQSTPDLVTRASALSLRSLLDEGTQTLQLVFRGILPRTFDAVFALAHIACAIAYIIHKDDGSHCWNDFFLHILKMHTLIQNGNDTRVFVQLVNLLWWPQGSSAKRFCSSYFLDESSGTLVPLRRPVVGLGGLASTAPIDSQAPRYPTKQDSMTNFHWLQDGPVLEQCSRFLDGLEYAGILERSKQHPTNLSWYAQNHVTNIEEMLKTIIHPLQRCVGIEALHDAINTTAIELGSGSLRSVREVEVSLISNGKSLSLSSTVYEKFLDTVASICDYCMHEAGPKWRHRCYATDLDVVLASVVEMDNRQRPEHCHRRYTNVNVIPDNIQTWHRSHPIPSSIESQTPISTSLSAVTSPTFTGGYSLAAQPSPSTSPESSFSAPTPSSSSADVTRCPLCPTLFTGSARDRTSNLRRHMRTTREHGKVVGLLCRVPGCGAMLSRSDNLGKHMRTVHRADTGAMLTRAGAQKRRDPEDAE